jgi:DNA-binding response OmpR family regulator
MKASKERIRTVPNLFATPFEKNWRDKGENKMTSVPVRSKILVIDDHPDILILITDILQRVGFEITAAKTGAEGIRLAQNHEFDLITVDIDLPDMTGFDICAQLKQDFRFYRTPIIFVSGRPSEDDRRHGFEVGAADFIIKPFDTFVFVSRILSHVKPAKN